MKKKWIVAGGAAASLAAWYLYASSRFGARKVPYTIVEKDGRFELRDYPPIHVAIAEGDAEDDTFRRLFRYISRGNVKQQKIAMTTPVLVNDAAMAFVMPPGAGVPDPVDETITIGSRAGGRVAALRFHGSPERAIASLRRAIAERQLEPEGDPFLAYYDAPWTPPVLRRNEVMLRVK